MNTQGSSQFLVDARDSQVGVRLDLNYPPSGGHIFMNDMRIEGRSQNFLAELDRGSESQIRDFVEIIDDDDEDDDVTLIDSTMFHEAKANSRRTNSVVTHGLLDVLNEAGGVLNSLSGELKSWCSKRQRTSLADAILDAAITNDEASQKKKAKPNLPKTPVMQEPVYSCPVCLEEIKQATATKCGHVFCFACIKAAVAVQRKCPTCRQKVGKQGYHRIYFPSTV